MAICLHRTTEMGLEHGFFGPVSVEPYTAEDTRAHGGISHVETCLSCGAQREWNQNGRFSEHSPWGPPAVVREREERAAVARERDATLRAVETMAERTRVLAVDDGHALVSVLGREPQRFALHDLRAAAAQPDTGEGLVQFYTDVLRKVEAQTV